MTLILNRDLTVTASKPGGDPFSKALKGGKEYKVTDVLYNGSTINFTLTGKIRVLKLSTKYLKR